MRTSGDIMREEARLAVERARDIGDDVLELLRVMRSEVSMFEGSIVKTQKGLHAGIQANRLKLIEVHGSGYGCHASDRNHTRTWNLTERGYRVLDIADKGGTPIVRPDGEIGQE